MTKILVDAEIKAEDLPLALSSEFYLTRNNYHGLIDFVLQLDAYVDDLQFTTALRNQLDQIIQAASE